MKRKLLIVVLAISLSILIFSAVHAQGFRVLNAQEIQAFSTNFDAPSGSAILTVIYFEGYNTFALPVTSSSDVCPLVRVYKVSPQGVQDLWPSSCSGNTVTVNSGGTGHYIFYYFNGASAAQNASPRILR
jgi:hypothetical protein